AEQAGHERPPVGPFPGALQAADRASADGLAFEKTLQVFGQGKRRRITLPRILIETFEANRFQVARGLGLKSPRSDRLLRANLLQRVERCCTLKRRTAGEQLVEDGAEGPDIGRRPYIVAAHAGLFRRHVLRSADDVAGVRAVAVVVDLLGEAE